tara:strand:- start:84 stop:242 length:159 start_codon:yes stop_codon:yes gene_type:complete
MGVFIVETEVLTTITFDLKLEMWIFKLFILSMMDAKILQNHQLKNFFEKILA